MNDQNIPDFHTDILQQSGIQPIDTKQITHDIGTYGFMSLVFFMLFILILFNLYRTNR